MKQTRPTHPSAFILHPFEKAREGLMSEQPYPQPAAAGRPAPVVPIDLHGLRTYELASRPSKVFVEDLGRPVGPDASLGLAAHRAGIPVTVHVALGTDVVHVHPHVSGAALGESSLIDFRRLCSVVATLEHGVWMNLGSAVVLPEVLLKAVSVVRNFGYDLDGLVTVNVDKESR